MRETRRPRRRLALLLFLAVLTALAVLILGTATVVSLLEPLEDPATAAAVRVEIPPGTGTAGIARILEERGVIKNALVFRLAARYQKVDGKLQAGEYELSPGMTGMAILERLERGDVIQRRFTIPEGLRVSEVIERMARAGLGTVEDLSAAFRNPSLAADWLPDGVTLGEPLEGYLMPDTYTYTGEPSAAEWAEWMVDAVRSFWTEKNQARAERLGLTVHEAVTLASIVEEEAKLPEERPLIAGVYLHRLRRGMLLQADPTVLYGAGKASGEPIMMSDLQADNPYNTYRVHGLPPGPIANPGRESLEAVLSPAETEYLYFVARPDGGHAFARTLAEHQQNVQAYQR